MASFYMQHLALQLPQSLDLRSMRDMVPSLNAGLDHDDIYKICPYSTCFWKLAKNAGTSLLKGWLMPTLCHNLLPAQEDFETLFGGEKVPPGCAELIKQWSYNESCSCNFNFTVLRNPWHRTISIHSYITEMRDAGVSKIDKYSLRDFLTWPDTMFDKVITYVHREEQVVSLFRRGALGHLSLVASVETLTGDIDKLVSGMNTWISGATAELKPGIEHKLNPTSSAIKSKASADVEGWPGFEEAVRLMYPLDTSLLGYEFSLECSKVVRKSDDCQKHGRIASSDPHLDDWRTFTHGVPLQPAFGCELYADRSRGILIVQASSESFSWGGLGHASAAASFGVLGGAWHEEHLVKTHTQAKQLQTEIAHSRL